MYREIKKKKLILENRKPFTREAQRLIDEMGRVEWIHSSLILDGQILTKSQVEALLRGEFLEEISVGGHLAVNNLNDGISEMLALIDMENDLDQGLIEKIYYSLSGEKDKIYRQNNPVLRTLAYNPPHFKEIEEQIELLLKSYHAKEKEENPLKTAAWLHNSLVEIYPYQSLNEMVARMVSCYHLLAKGFPLVPWNMDEQKYYDAIRLYLRTEDSRPIYSMLEASTFQSLEIMMQLT